MNIKQMWVFFCACEWAFRWRIPLFFLVEFNTWKTVERINCRSCENTSRKNSIPAARRQETSFAFRLFTGVTFESVISCEHFIKASRHVLEESRVISFYIYIFFLFFFCLPWRMQRVTRPVIIYISNWPLTSSASHRRTAGDVAVN